MQSVASKDSPSGLGNERKPTEPKVVEKMAPIGPWGVALLGGVALLEEVCH